MKCKAYICYNCGNCLIRCKVCNVALSDFRKSEDLICDYCLDKKED